MEASPAWATHIQKSEEIKNGKQHRIACEWVAATARQVVTPTQTVAEAAAEASEAATAATAATTTAIAPFPSS